MFNTARKTSVKFLIPALLATLYSAGSFAHDKSDESAILIIGASYANASTPIFNDLQAPLGGTAVNSGRYLSLGDALVREKRLSGHVINEAQAGATSFPRLACFPGPACVGPGWEGYDRQLDRALRRVTSGTTVFADYVVIARGNDCNHPDAFGIPMDQTSECTEQQMNESIDNYIAVAKKAQALGITPIMALAPEYNRVDFEKFRQALGWSWIISESSYNTYSQLRADRIRSELPDAILIDMWAGFEHISDGLHPNRKTTQRAAKRIAKAIKKHKRQQAQ